MRRAIWVLLIASACAGARPPVSRRPSKVTFHFVVEETHRPYEAGVCACIAIGCAPERGVNPIFLTARRYATPIRGGDIEVDRPSTCGDRPLRVEVHYEVANELGCFDPPHHAQHRLEGEMSEIELPARCGRPEYHDIISRPPEQGAEGGVSLSGTCTFEELDACFHGPFSTEERR